MDARDELKQEVLRATDITSLVERHVQLSGTGRMRKGLCPFHQEKTPSFTVSPDRGVAGTWHCFGCGKGGNAIDFVMERERVDFRTALRALADQAGIRVPERGKADRAAADARLEALEVQRHAQDFFRRCFVETKEGERARAYVAKRGIDEEFSERFGIGYAPQRWDGLVRYLANRGFTGAQAERAGVALAKKSGRGHVDRFRGRLMFPIHDVLGKVVGFGGRAFSDDDPPKYLNSAETPIFKKREILYGLHLAKDAARERGEIAVVEGYTDAILAHQAGFPWVVATLGTAFGADHANQLKRIARKLLVFFDGDEAGAKANRRSLVEAAKHAVEKFSELRVAELPDGLDPADLIVERGAGALAQAIEKAVSLSEFFVAAAGSSTAERAKAIEETCEILAGLEADTYRELEIAATAHRFHVEEELVRREVRRFRDLAVKKNGAPPLQRGGPAIDPGEAPAAPLGKRDRWLLESLLAVPELVEDARARGISPADGQDPRARAVLDALFAGQPVNGLEDEGARRLAAEIVAGLAADKPYAREWPGVAARLLEERRETGCTNGSQDELKEWSDRKLRRMELQKRDLSLNSGERAGE